jgi:hypothetical protein
VTTKLTVTFNFGPGRQVQVQVQAAARGLLLIHLLAGGTLKAGPGPALALGSTGPSAVTVAARSVRVRLSHH